MISNFVTNSGTLIERPLRRSFQPHEFCSLLFVLRRDKACLVSTNSPLTIHHSRKDHSQ